jgi:1,4-dihydroxy-2-naphthoate octaprenyltransferase
MPVYLFALSQVENVHTQDALLIFVILHLLVYPASNLFNGYYDNDQGSVGGLKNPPPPNSKMLWLANTIDISALILSVTIETSFAFLVLIYIFASRLYSYKSVRFKKYTFLGFLVIFIFQGAFTFYLVSYGCSKELYECGVLKTEIQAYFALLACSFQIGAIYPLTQIYQHESDLADGVTTLSYKLGYRGTFIFAGAMFGIATLFYYLHFKEIDINSFYLFTLVQIPIIGYFVYWGSKVWKDTKYADYKHTMYMNAIAAVILNLFFLYLVVK